MRNKAYVLIAAIWIGLATLAGAQEPTTMTAVAPLAVTSPTLDGIMSPGEWSDANSYTFDGVDQLRPGWVNPAASLTPADWSCTFWVKHDGSYVYVATAVTDDVIQNDSGTNQWDDDAMEIYFDPNNSNSSTKEATAIGGFQISYKASDASGTGGQGYNQWWWAKAVIVPPGYVVEFRVSKSLTGMVTGRKYGFDLSPDDDDDGAGRDHQIWWNAQDANAWNNEIPWGDIILSTQPLVTPPTTPAAPTNLTAEGFSSTQINLAWTDNANNETGFKIERSPDGSAFTEIAVVNANAVAYANTGLSPATAYWYRVRAYNTAGDSAYSNVANASTRIAVGPYVREPFTYADNVDVVGQNGGTGFTGPWADRYQATGKMKVVGGRAQYMTGSTGWAAAARPFPQWQDGKTYYVSWDIIYPSTVDWAAQRTYPSFFLGMQSADECANIGLVDPAATPLWKIRGFTITGSQVKADGPPVALNTPHHVVAQFNLKGTSDSIYAWVNPNPVTTTAPQMALTSINLRHGTSQEITHISVDMKDCPGLWFDNYEITTQPAPLRDFRALMGANMVRLVWNDPMTAVLAGVKVQRRADRFPSGPTDGTTVFNGAGTSCDDTAVISGQTYYYAAFGYDPAGSYSEGVTAVASPGGGALMGARRSLGYR